jgi:hypothetical protein
MIGVLHGGVVLQVLLGLAFLIKTQPDSLSFLNAAWGDTYSSLLLEQTNACVTGYLLKDYIIFYEDGLELGYIVHHIASIIGIGMHLNFPAGAGLISLQACQCEFGSAAFSYGTMFPSKISKTAYLVLMLASNSFAIYLTSLVL